MYPAKIMLFGEYSVLIGSEALALPYNQYGGEWAWPGDRDRSVLTDESNLNLKSLLKHLSRVNINEHFLSLDLHAFSNDLNHGLYFDSSIPVSAGLGSSGALVAALYERYVKNPAQHNEIVLLVKQLALLERYFHGSSSGTDPLVSYLKKSLHINSDGKINPVPEEQCHKLEKHGFFLVKSSAQRKTKTLISYFKKRCTRDDQYVKLLQKKYVPLNNDCIKGWISDMKFFQLIRDLSVLQIRVFKAMIPDDIMGCMEYGLRHDLFFMKLCGAGGGGYFIGFTPDLSTTKIFFKMKGLDFQTNYK